jgi:hypothetical protein
MSIRIHPSEYFLGVPTASKGDIYIDTSGLQIHPLDTFVEENRYVICGFFFHHF